MTRVGENPPGEETVRRASLPPKGENANSGACLQTTCPAATPGECATGGARHRAWPDPRVGGWQLRHFPRPSLREPARPL